VSASSPATSAPSRRPNMANNTLVINCDLRETRVALIENGIIAELHIERAAARGSVGNIVLGRVTRVLPGMQAAFIDVGMERAAFLHVEDLIRPDDFESYLSGRARDGDAEPSGKGEGGRRVFAQAQAVADDEEDEDEGDEFEPLAAVSVVDNGEENVEDNGHSDEHAVAPAATPALANHHSVDEEDEDDLDEEDDVEEEEEQEEEEEEKEQEEAVDEAALASVDDGAEPQIQLTSADRQGMEPPPAGPNGADEDTSDDDPADDEAVADEPGSPGDAAEADTNDSSGAQTKRRRRRRRRRPATGVEKEALAQPTREARPAREARPDARAAREARLEVRPAAKPRETRDNRRTTPRRDAQLARDRGNRRNGAGSSRVSRSVPITEVVKEGDEVIVQISKEPIGTKGARVTSHVSLPGRYVVYLPTVEHVGISKRIGSPRERARLRAVIETMKPQTGGLIVRTVAEGLTKKALKADIGYLIKLWAEISRKHETAKAPSVLSAELDLVLKTARDLFTDEIDRIVIDDKDQHARLVRFVEMFLPERAKDIELYAGDEPIFDAYGIEDEISRALSRKVPLSSGGYLIIDQAEALTAIDVNTGRYVGKGSRDLEETALKTNLEAVSEIAYQLRFRNIGGLVILDLIDMENASNRDKVWRALEHGLGKDKAKTTLNRISELGLIEMTRKRTRESLSRILHEPCFYCDGTGQIQSRTTIAYEILRQIRRERLTLPGYVVMVNAHPAVVDLMTGEEKTAVAEAERRYMRRIEFNARREYHIEQFDLQGK